MAPLTTRRYSFNVKTNIVSGPGVAFYVDSPLRGAQTAQALDVAFAEGRREGRSARREAVSPEVAAVRENAQRRVRSEAIAERRRQLSSRVLDVLAFDLKLSFDRLRQKLLCKHTILKEVLEALEEAGHITIAWYGKRRAGYEITARGREWLAANPPLVPKVEPKSFLARIAALAKPDRNS